MKAKLEPILEECRAIYDLEGVMDRYWVYVNLMTKTRGELVPLGDFSPMGRRQKDFLHVLIKMKAEEFAQEVCDQVGAEINVDVSYRVMLVVVDEPANGWTQRYLTDADWRFSDKIEKLAKSSGTPAFDRWVTVNLWTTDESLHPREPSYEWIQMLVRSALFRAHLQRQNGYPVKLADMLRQEGMVMVFSGENLPLTTSDLAKTEEIIVPLLESTNFATNFAALYGDEAALSVGYSPLGLKPKAGFALARVQSPG